MNLDEYRRKRRFQQTPEPTSDGTKSSKRGRSAVGPKGDAPRRFVIHKHDATKLHFDLRLEHAGVLLCWAVPRGPSLDPNDRRLAVQTEDHPIEYIDFEGLIPVGNYGAGPMIIWDRGQWVPDKPPEQAIADGKLKLTLSGERLQGRWTLVRTGGASSRQWLLIKEKETPKSASRSAGKRPPAAAAQTQPVISERTSVASGRTLAQIRAGIPANRPARGKRRQASESELPHIDPKLPTLVQQPPRGEDWIHELKLDGYRMQVRIAAGQVQLITRGGHDWTDRLPELADAAASLSLRSGILDGELVALTAEGVTDFSSLQAAVAQGRTGQLVMFFFDLLYLNQQLLADRPLLERKAKLEPLIRKADNPRLQYLDHVGGSPAALWQACRQRGLEGIVSKRVDRPYRGGRASDWLKTKHRRRDRFVIGGVERSSNAVAGIGALAVGYFDPAGRLIDCGKVGGGWTQAVGESLLKSLESDRAAKSPFVVSTSSSTGATAKSSWRASGPSASMMWVRPRIVVEVDFAGVTTDGNLRQASLTSVLQALPGDSVVRDCVSEDVPKGDLIAGDETTPRQTTAKGSRRPARGKSSAGQATDTASSSQPAVQLSDILQRVKVTSPERVLFPDCRVTKLDLIAYLLQVSRWMLPHIQDRLVSVVRCPHGITGETFFQRHPGKATPSAMKSISVAGEAESYLNIADLEGLVATAQMNAIEIHPWGSRIDRVDRPDRIVLDLDPDPAVLWPEIVDAAWIIRNKLREHGLTSFAKTSGGKGLHIVIPIARRYSWERVGRWCQEWVDQMVAANPKRFTGNLSKQARRGKIFIDHLRNRRGATSVAAYCVRARPGAIASVPIFWEELTASLRPQQWTIHSVPERLKQLGADPWAELSELRQSLK